MDGLADYFDQIEANSLSEKSELTLGKRTLLALHQAALVLMAPVGVVWRNGAVNEAVHRLLQQALDTDAP